jgi:hypothetical protein
VYSSHSYPQGHTYSATPPPQRAYSSIRSANAPSTAPQGYGYYPAHPGYPPPRSEAPRSPRSHSPNLYMLAYHEAMQKQRGESAKGSAKHRRVKSARSASPGGLPKLEKAWTH